MKELFRAAGVNGRCAMVYMSRNREGDDSAMIYKAR